MLEAARAGTPAPDDGEARALGRSAAPWKALVAAQAPALRELVAAYGAADAAPGDDDADARLERAVHLERLERAVNNARVL